MAAHPLHLHVGTMKSGTSYLQNVFNANVARLSEQGVLWPMAAMCFRGLGDLLGMTEGRPLREGAWPVLRQMLRCHDGPALLSNEIVGGMGAGRRVALLDALGAEHVRIVITVRDLARVVPSQWQTAVRSQGLRSWREFAEAVCSSEPSPIGTKFWRRQDVAAMVQRWSQRMPLERITVVTVPPPGSEPFLLVERFGTAVGIDMSSFRLPGGLCNSTMGATSAELLRRLNQRTSEVDQLHYRLGFKDGLSRAALATHADQEPAIAMRPDEFAFVRRRAAEIVDGLTASGVRVVGDLADLVPSEPPPGAAASPCDASDEALLDAALTGLTLAGRVLAEARVEHDELIRAALRLLGDDDDPTKLDDVDDDDESAEAPGGRRLAASRAIRERLAALQRE